MAGTSYRDESLTQLAQSEAPDDFTFKMLQAIRLAGERSNSDQVSPAGARGVYQFMPATFSKFADEGADPTDPTASTRAASRYIQYARKLYGDNPAAIAAEYNGGPRQANAVLQNGEPLANETKAYVPRVVKHFGGDDDARMTGGSKRESSDPFGWVPIQSGAGKGMKPQPDDPFGWSPVTSFSNAPDPAKNANAGLMSDTGNLLKSGVNQVASGLREAVRQTPVVGDSLVSGADAADKFVTGKTSDEILKDDNERIQGALSDKMRGALDKKWWNSETQSLGDAWTDPRAYAGGIIQSLPGTLLTMIPAGRLAKMAYEAKVATLGAEEAAKASARTAMLAGGAGEGLLSAGQTAGDVREELGKLPQSVWESSEAYKSLRASGMDDASAKNALTNDAATKGFLIAGVTTAIFGGQGDRVLALAMRGGISGGVVKRFIKGGLGEGLLEEAPQSYTQEIAKNVGVQTVDPTRQTTEGAFNAALGGFAVGEIQGGGMNAVLGHSAPERTAKDATSLSEAATMPVTPVVKPDELLALPSPTMPATNGVMVQGESGVRPQTYGEATSAEQARLQADKDAAERAQLGLGEAQRIQIGSDAKNGFQHGPDGTRYRTGIVSATGGVMLDVRYRNGGVGSFYVGVDGNMVDADSVNLVGDGASKIWKPTNEAQSTKVQELLRERAQLGLTDPKRKTLLAAIREIVTNTQPNTERAQLGLGEAQRIQQNVEAQRVASQEQAAQEAASRLQLPSPDMPANNGVMVQDAQGVRPQTFGEVTAAEQARTQADQVAAERARLGLGNVQRVNAQALAQIARPEPVAAQTPAQPEVTLRSDGQPFATLKAAETSIKARGLSGAVAVSVKGGGFGIRMAAPSGVQNSIPAQAIPAQAQRADTNLKATATLAQAIRKFGGLPEKFARDLTGEPAQTANKMPGYRGLFHASGTDLSTLVHDGKLDAYLPPNLRSDVRDDSRPTDTDAAVAHIEAIIRNGEAQTAKSYARTEAKKQRVTAAAQKQQVVAPVENGDTQAAADAISEAEYEHYKQTGEPGFGWMPGAEAFASSLDANTIEQIDALLNLPESTDERAAMRSMGFTEDEITETLGPDAAASAGANQVPESAPAASESTPASRETAPPAAEVTAHQAAIDADNEMRALDKKGVVVENADAYFALANKAEDARQAFAREIIESSDIGLSAKTSDGRQLVLNESAQQPGKWQMTRFARDGSPWGDTQFPSKAQAVNEFLREAEISTVERVSGNNQPTSVNPHEAAAKALESAAAALREVGRPALDLTSPTESKLRTDDAKQKRDAAEKAAKENAPSPEGFTFIGSNRAADVGAAAGQDALFSRPGSNEIPEETIRAIELLQTYEGGSKKVTNSYTLRELLSSSATGSKGQFSFFPKAIDVLRKIGVDGDALKKVKRIGADAMQYVDYGPHPILDTSIADLRNGKINQIENLFQKDGNKIFVPIGDGKVATYENVSTSGSPAYKWLSTSKVDAAFSRADTIEVDGKQRSRNNSNGKPIAATDEGIRNFWRWFGSSKVVDEHGRPRVMYHGTTKDFSTFDKKFLYSGEGASQTGSGFYFTDNPESASGYSARTEGSNVLSVYLALQKPLKIDFALGEVNGAELTLTKPLVRKVIMQAPNIRNVEESPLLNFGDIGYEGFDKVLQQAIEMYANGNNIAALRNDFFGNDNASWLKAFEKATGYDSATTTTGNGDTHFVAWSSEQIKSATGNTGQFSPDNADIRYSRDNQQPTPTNTHAADVIAKAAKTVNIPLDVYATPQEAAKKLGINIPSDVRGLFYKGRAALISSNITSPAMGEFVLWHELLHAGITQVAPRYGAEYNRIMQDMAARNANVVKAARDWRNSYGEETIQRSIDAGLSREQAEKRMRLMAIEEAIADLSGANAELKGWTQFVAKLQALLRSMGFDNLANWIEGKTNAEVLQLISRTRDEVTTQNLHLTTQVPAFARDEDDASYQRAYHGTPHKFDKFSLDKIGTGEGAQAYGYGLYFASKKEIAEHYRSTLATSTVSTQDGALGVNGLADALVKRAAPAPQLEAATRSKAVQIATAIIVNGKSAAEVAAEIRASRYAQTYSALADALETMGADKTRGQLYTVDIPEDSEMLHWDKPLSEQPEAVKVALEKSNPALFQKNWYDAETKQTTELGETSGKMLNGVLSEVMDGSEYYRSLSSQTGGGAQASTKLRSLGIRGIKYLDGGSRNAGDGSYNYVVFDDKDVNIEAVHSRTSNDGMPAFDNASGNYNPDLPKFWIDKAKKEINGEGMSDAEYHTAVAEYANRWRVGELLEANGWKARGSSNISPSTYFTKDVGIGEYDDEYKSYDEYKTYEIRVSDHNDFHKPRDADGIEQRFQVNYRTDRADWSDTDISPNDTNETARAKLDTLLPNEQTTSQDGDVAFSRSNIAGQTTRDYTPEQLNAFKNTGRTIEEPTMKERAQSLWKDAGKKMAQGLVDQFAPVKDISKEAYGLLRLSKGASGAFETLLRGGKLKLTDNVYDVDTNERGGVVEKLLQPLQGEHVDFLWWVAANRAERLKGEGKENLFTADDIKAYKALADGETSFDYTLKTGPDAGKVTRNRAEVYADSNRVLSDFNKNVLDMAEQSGLIDGTARKLWEHEFYIPFYRVAEEGGFTGAGIKSGAIRQQAFKELKGGKQALNSDLLDNMLMNWAHLLDASAKNRAATATIDAAERLGIASGADQETLKQMGASIGNKNGVVWVMDGGQKRYSLIDNQGDGPFILTALTALEYAGMNSPIMKAMGTMKHALTVGVTSSPFFKVRNLIRDSVQAIGTSALNVNPATNLAQGWKLTDPKSDEYFRLLAGGGTIHFASMYEGSEAKRVQALVESGIDDSTILNDSNKIKTMYRKYIEPAVTAYNELGNRGEAINRAALYDQLRKQGMNHAEASLQARDLMDFSMQGTFTSIRFLTQVVPFFNARLQGLYKLGRSAKDDPARMAAVTGAVTLASLALLAAYGDDDDWKKREEWDRNNFWWFKIGGTAFRIPKPFEVGAVATLAERGFELAFDKEMTGTRFRKQVMTLLGDNLSMNPVPQLVKPILEVYANKGFNDRPIETMGMDHLKPEYRFTDKTSMAARGISTAANSVTGLIGVDSPSPVQVDHMLRGYFGWLGSFVVGAGDIIARPATGQPERPSSDIWKAATGGMVSDLRDAPSRYVTQMYTQAKELEQAYGTYHALLKQGKTDEAQSFAKDNIEELAKYRNVEHVKKQEAKLNERARMIERSNLDADTKRETLRSIQEQKDRLARTIL